MSGDPLNPGSAAAIAIGCICSAEDNNHGRFAPWSPDGWWAKAECPVHGHRCDACGATDVQVSHTRRFADWSPMLACDDVQACWERRAKLEAPRMTMGDLDAEYGAPGATS